MVHLEKPYLLSQALCQSPHSMLCGCIESVSRAGHAMRRHGRYVNDMAPLPSSLHVLRMLDKVACAVKKFCYAYDDLLNIVTHHLAHFTIRAGWQ